MPTAINPKTGERLALVNGQWVPASPKAPIAGPVAPKLTEGQAKDGFNAARMRDSGAIVSRMEGKGFDAGAASLLPGIIFDDKREYGAASKEWADALLRLTTGAAATKDEIDRTEKTYFPQFGDSPQVRKQKADMRAKAEQNAVYRAGPGAPRPSTPPPTASPAVKPKAVKQMSNDELKRALGL